MLAGAYLMTHCGCSAVKADQVAVAQAVVVGDAVRDGVVHGGAEGGEQDMSA